MNRDDEVVGHGRYPAFGRERAHQEPRTAVPFGIFRLLHAISRPDELEMALIAVRPDYQKLGVNSLMIARIMKNIIEDGIHKIESNPELVSNVAVQSQWTSLERRVIKRRKTFVKQI